MHTSKQLQSKEVAMKVVLLELDTHAYGLLFCRALNLNHNINSPLY